MDYNTIPDIMSVEEMRSILKIGRNKAYAIVGTGAIKSLKIGRTIRIPKRYVVDFIESQCYNGKVATGRSLTSLEVVR